MKRETIEILGETIFYLEENNNKPKVLFLHGFNSSSNFANEVYKLQNRNYDIIAIDFPGCGNSSANNVIKIEFYQQIAEEFVKAKKLTDFIVVGHSLGGASALHLVNKELAKYALLAAPINYNIFIGNIKKSQEKLKSWLLPTNIQEAKDSSEHLVYESKRNYKQNIEAISKAFLRITNLKRNMFYNLVIKQMVNPIYLKTQIKELYKEISPYEFITGDKDFFVPHKSIEAIAKAQNKKITLIKNCGHALFFEKPEEINQKIEEILKYF